MASDAPPPTIDRALVDRLCVLSALELPDAEKDRFAADLQRIVGHMQTLAQVDVSGVDPLCSVRVGPPKPLRADQVVASLPIELALREAPKTSDQGFAVPRFVDLG